MATRKKRAPVSRTKSGPTRSLLTSLSSDWYWEQDADLRFTRVNVQSSSPAEQDLARQILGKRRWETGIQVEGGWAAHRKLLQAHSPFRDLVMWRDFQDGGRRYISVSGQPVFDTRGRFTGYRGVGRDITALKRGEQLLRLQHSVTRGLAEASGARDGIERGLRAICESEHWDCGEFWRLDEGAGVMRRFAHRVLPGVTAAQRFAELSGAVTFKPGQGLVGAVWQSGEPLWIEDAMQDERALRKSVAAETGLRGVLLCPVPSGGRLVGIISFQCCRIRSPDEALLQALMALATQLGLFLQRAESEDRLRESEERFRRTFELAGVGIAHIGLDRRFLRLNRRFREILGYSEAELAGKTGRDISHPADRDHMNAERPRLYAGEIDAVRGEKRYLRKDGSVVWVAYTLALQRDDAGNPLYEIAVYDDIGQRKAAEEALRDSEGRFRSLTELSSDFFWEQDHEYRFTRIEGTNVAGGDVALRARLIGARRWDSGLQIEGGWEAHRALLDTHQPFHEVLMWRTMTDGSLRYVSISGEPVFAADGSFAGYRGVGRDVTEEKRAEQLLRLEHQVARALADAEDESAGMKAVLRAICEEEDWSCGRFFRLDAEREEMCFAEGWGRDEPRIAAFLEASRTMRFGLGKGGLIGHAWAQREAVWSSDTSTDTRSLAMGLKSVGLRGAFVFPVISGGQTLGVLSFISGEVRTPDERLLQATRVLGAQVGQFLQRKRAEESLRRNEARFRSLTEMSSDFFWETDPQHRFTSLVHGPGYSQQIGRIVGKTAWDLPYTHPDEAAWNAFRATMHAHEPFRDFELGRPWNGGTVRYFLVSGEPNFAPDGSFLGYRGVGRDITDIVLARERIASLAYQDVLTGLDNRVSMTPALEKAVERTRRRGSKLAGLFLDLDGFKQINDLHGHDAGDRLLVQVAERLRNSLRSSDLVARLGGDEFFIVLEDLNDRAPAERVAKKLLASVLEPYDIAGGKQAHVSASVGISLYPDDAGDAATLVKHADLAMYAAKQAGKNGYRFFTAGPAANDVRPAEQDARSRA